MRAIENFHSAFSFNSSN